MAESYTVLARRYRSQSFDQLVGQEAIAQTLKNAITAGRVAHAFLLTGTRGVGKTSVARILAKAINCPNTKDGEPCNACDTCKAISRGEDMDVIEIDGASNNGVENIRELRQAAGIRPARSAYKIYIIDEVHMVTTSAFNALLKTLEEPPPHVKFIFATTDVHKVPATIISRVQRFDFKNIPTAKIADHLAHICRDEGIAADKEALHRIARLGNGSMRDALSILDRVLSLGEKHLTEKLLEDLLGKPPTAAIAELVESLADADAALALKRADALLKDGMGVDQLLGELIEFFRNLMIVAACGNNTELLDVQNETRPVFLKLAAKYDAPTLVHLIALCEQALRAIKATTMARPMFDALVVRLALSEQFSSIKQLLDGSTSPSQGQKKNDTLSDEELVEAAFDASLAAEGGPVGPGATAAAPPPADEDGDREASIYDVMKEHMARKDAERNAAWQARQSEPPAHRPRPHSADEPDENPAEVSFNAQIRAQLHAAGRPVPMSQRPAARPAASAPAGPVIRVEDLSDLPAVWRATMQHLGANKAASINTMLGEKAHLESCNGAEATLAIPSHLRGYAGERIKTRIEESLRIVTGRGIKLNLTTYEDAGGEHSRAQGGGAGPGSSRVAPEVVEAVRQSPVVRLLMERLSGEITQVEMITHEEE